MRRYFGRKFIIYLLTFWVAATIDWMIPRFMPGDPVQGLLSRTQVAPEAVADLIDYYNRLFGLDQPLPLQYLNFWARNAPRRPRAERLALRAPLSST